jgi:hypothetical protein
MTEMARALNGRTQAWPLGAAVMVPAHQAAAAAFFAPGAVIEDNALRLSATGGLAVGPAVAPSQPPPPSAAASLLPAAAAASSSSSAAVGGDSLLGANAPRLAAPVKIAPSAAAAAGAKGGRGKGAGGGASSAAVAAAFGADGGS